MGSWKTPFTSEKDKPKKSSAWKQGVNKPKTNWTAKSAVNRPKTLRAKPFKLG